MIDIITHPIFYWSVIIFVVPGILLWIATYIVASYCVYNQTLRRKNAEQWSRDLPNDMDPEQRPMYEAGLKWAEEHQEYKHDVHIVRDGVNLYGEYYDLGYDKCVVVLSGRTESLKYGYYFGIPYTKSGYNVLVLDPRGHGLSDGEFNTVGHEESRDDICWIEFMEKTYGIKHFVFHGICIGSAGGILALTSGKCSDSVKAIVTEGMFPNFSESVKNHLIERKKPVFIMLDLIDAWMKHYTGHTMKVGPINFIDKLNVPLLMLHSKEDKYSTPEYAQKLYDKAGSKLKRLVWFEHGRHSMLRITNTELYDTSITEFLADISAENK